MEPRKNHHLLIQALKELPPQMHLCIAGKKTNYYEELKTLAGKLGVENRVKFISDFEFHKLPEIIHNAKICCYLSQNEGFGIPILEYMAMGKPVVLANTHLSKEVAGDAGAYTVLSMEGIVKTLRQLSEQEEQIKQLGELSKKRAAAFETLRLYLQLDKLFEKTT